MSMIFIGDKTNYLMIQKKEKNNTKQQTREQTTLLEGNFIYWRKRKGTRNIMVRNIKEEEERF